MFSDPAPAPRPGLSTSVGRRPQLASVGSGAHRPGPAPVGVGPVQCLPWCGPMCTSLGGLIFHTFGRSCAAEGPTPADGGPGKSAGNGHPAAPAGRMPAQRQTIEGAVPAGLMCDPECAASVAHSGPCLRLVAAVPSRPRLRLVRS